MPMVCGATGCFNVPTAVPIAPGGGAQPFAGGGNPPQALAAGGPSGAPVNQAQPIAQDVAAAQNVGQQTAMQNCCPGCGCKCCKCCANQQPGAPGAFAGGPQEAAGQPAGQAGQAQGAGGPQADQAVQAQGAGGPQAGQAVQAQGAGGPQAGQDTSIEGQIRDLIGLIQGLMAKLGEVLGIDPAAGGPAAGNAGQAPVAGAGQGAAEQIAAPGGATGQEPVQAQGGAPAAAPVAGPGDAQASKFEQRLLELVNQTRREMGLPQVQWNDDMAKLARRSAAAKTHTAAPEVLAPYGYSSPEDAMNAWRQSPGHWSIITDPNLTQMGTGWVGDGAAMTFGNVDFPGWEGK